MQYRVEMMVIVLIGLSMSQRVRAEEVLPEPDLLEYLGSLVEDDGNYVDPLDMEDFQNLSPNQGDSPTGQTVGHSARRSGTEQPLSPAPSGGRP